MQSFAPRSTQLGEQPVQRFLPQRMRRTVGAWCFLDVFGPAPLDGRKLMDVPPHPHIGLQTVTWLFEGEVLHRDSLGYEALARRGALNLMTAGHGIAHSEESPVGATGRLHGVQLWIALPDASRHGSPAFDHYPERPTVELSEGQATVILGEIAGIQAPGRIFSPLLAAELTIAPSAELVIPLDRSFEHAILPIDGGVVLADQPLDPERLYFFEPGIEVLQLGGRSDQSCRVLLIGGEPFTEPLLMWWNFVARNADEIIAAREDWQAHRRFGEVRGYPGERLAAPEFIGRPVPANPMS